MIQSLILVLLLVNTLPAEQNPRTIGSGDSTAIQIDGQFGAMMHLVGDAEEYLSSWETVTPHFVVVPIETPVPKGQPVFQFVVFSNCEAGENGLCDATIDFRITRPDGSDYSSLIGQELWIDKPPTALNHLQLSVFYSGTIFEPEDPVGVYSFHASVHDNNSGKTLELISKLEVTEE
jgi:hypothetical protein